MNLESQLYNFHSWLNMQKNINAKKRLEIMTFMGELNKLENVKFDGIYKLLRSYLRANITEHQTKKVLAYVEDRLELLSQLMENKNG